MIMEHERKKGSEKRKESKGKERQCLNGKRKSARAKLEKVGRRKKRHFPPPLPLSLGD